MGNAAGVAAGLALGLGIGIGAGALLFGGGTPPDDALTGEAPPPAAAPAAATAPAPAPLPAAPAPAPRAAPTPAQADDEVAARVAGALRDVAMPLANQGDGVITGSVKTVDGNPLAGVTIRLRYLPATRASHAGRKPGGGPPKEESLEEAVARTIRYRREQAPRDVQTGADGTFQAGNLREGRWRLTAYARGYEMTGNQRYSATVKTGEAIHFVAAALVELPVTITGAEGAPQPIRVSVSLLEGSSTRTTTQPWSAEEPFVRVRPGRYRLRAQAGDTSTSARGVAAELESEPVEVVVEANAAPPEVRLVLGSKRGIRGRVSGLEHAGTRAQVFAMRVESGEPDLAKLSRSRTQAMLWSGRDAYDLPDLEPGRWVVGVAKGWRGKILAHKVVQVGDGMTQCDLRIPAPDPSKILKVRLLNEHGKPVGEARFTLCLESDGWSSSSGTEAKLGPDGLWTIDLDDFPDPAERRRLRPGSEPPKLKNVKRFVEVATSLHGKHRRLLPEPPAGVLEIRLAAPASLTITVSGYAGSKLEGRLRATLVPADVGADEARRSGLGRREQRLDAKGSQRFAPLSASEYVLTLWLAPKGEDDMRAFMHELPVVIERITLQAGKNSRTLPFPRLYTVRVTLEGADAGTELRLATQGDDRWRALEAETDANGVAQFEDVPAGTYTVSDWSGAEQTIEVPRDTDVRLKPVVVRAFRVSITDPDGAMAKAGLQDDDLIIGMEGVEFESQMQISMLWMAAMKRPQTRLLLERGGQRLELSVSLADIQGDKAGGALSGEAR